MLQLGQRGSQRFSGLSDPKSLITAPNSAQNQRNLSGYKCTYNLAKTKKRQRPGQCAEQFQELKICVSPQFRAIDPPDPTRGFIRQNQNVCFATAACHPKCQNVRFATAACTKMYETSAWRRQSPAAYKNCRFTTVSNVRLARLSDERVPRRAQKFPFHHSFGRPTSTK